MIIRERYLGFRFVQLPSSHLAARQGNHLANETKAIGSVAFQNPLFPKGDDDSDNSPVTTEVMAIRDLALFQGWTGLMFRQSRISINSTIGLPRL